MTRNGAIVTQQSLRDQVLAILRKRLAVGDMVAGELYSATAIATELGVSSSPVREALLALVEQGVMEPIRNRGFRVVPMTERDRKDVHKLRLLIEVPTMLELVGHPEMERREHEFRAIAHEIVDAADRADYVAYLAGDRSFHLGLLGITGNERLVALVENLRDQTRQGGLVSLFESGQLRDTAEEHFLILDALMAKDSRLVESLMVAHLDHVVADWGPADS
ncbi:GntR family transcriptional regulator [Lysinibacter cavernae]|uniref:DNA-binding GntR family transcriptional regulator n=1 Tax=Lysinibacter cavernae TaxID=1640652 RepID=A0A7X5TU03_9MICO|nr:GntR family transcriptional regulator [Lysinibacter cavernae]NIH54745.1 DNA-binding GntR family transcriptional regulator [Lysinibacter cavernae]